MTASQRRAFTLVELLVVIAIIGILVAMLLPAVQSAREAARRMQCSNNLRQVVLALHNYHVNHQQFPIGVVWVPDRIGTHGPMFATWIGQLLPFLEQEAVYNLANFSQPNGSGPGNPWNIPYMKVRIATMQCPSDAVQVRANNDVYAKGNYAGNNGLGPMQFTASPTCADCTIPRKPGIFMNNSCTRISNLRDGTSCTVLVSELLQGQGDLGFQGVMHYWEGCLYQHDRTPNTSVADEMRMNFCGEPRTFAPCIGVFAPYSTQQYLSARSLHPGGVNSGFGDGSVKFVHDSIDMTLWQNLGTPADGQIVDLTQL